MSEVRVILVCGSRFAIPAIQELAFFKQLVVVAVPRENEDMLENVKVVLTGTSIPVLVLEKSSFAKQIKEAIENYHVTVGLVMTFGYKIPASIYKLPEHGFFNVHPGPLPGYRGPDPIFQQLKNKEENAGVTVHKLDEELDTGPIVITEMIRVERGDTYGLMTTKLSLLAIKLVRVLLKLISFGRVVPSRPQNPADKKYFKRQEAKDVTIDWETMDAVSINALINACNPWNKGAITKISNKIIRFVESEVIIENIKPQDLPGTVTEIGKAGLVVSTINEQALRVHIVYTEEGFLTTGRLEQLGILRGQRFEKITNDLNSNSLQKNL